MSGKRSRKERTEPEKGEGLWIISEPTPLGETYIVSMNLDDRAWALPPDDAYAWARYVMATATRADHDAAIVRQLLKTGLDRDASVQLVRELRADRPPLVQGNQPIRLEPGVSSDGEFRGFVAMYVDDEQVGQMDPLQAQEHATVVLGVLETADLDSAYYRALRGTVGLGEGTSRAVVHDLVEHRTMR